jgi:anhydro-N-acetylmuramic acid kinase
MRVLGFMSGTSLDAVDMAVLETDGETIQAFGPSGERKLDPGVRALVQKATDDARTWPWHAPEPESFAPAAKAVAEDHLYAAQGFMAKHGLTAADLDLVGFHGQTVWHEPPGRTRTEGRTVQLGDAALLARGLGLPVAYDFRSADVAAGGQGAPLAPIYHDALRRWSGIEGPMAVLNLGGVGNITLATKAGELHAFDTGPANGMIDLWVQSKTDKRLDEDGAWALAGRVHKDIVAAYLDHPYFQTRGAKSLDRYDFSLDRVAHLSLEDGAATLTAFAAAAVALGVESCPEKPQRIVVSGGGRRNPVLLDWIAEYVSVPVEPGETHGWRGDAVEAEAFAYLAARRARGLPISFPGTTGVPAPMTGGRIVEPRG